MEMSEARLDILVTGASSIDPDSHGLNWSCIRVHPRSSAVQIL
jgi:hypothetical protein